MPIKIVSLALAPVLALLIASPAQAFVVYSVINPSANFVFFTYEAPTFIMTDTLVPGSALTFNNTIHPATSVDFIISSPLNPGFADVQITINPIPGVPAVQDKFVPAIDLTQYGTWQAAAGSYGFPNSFVEVAAPEPAAVGLLGIGLAGLLALRRRSGKAPAAG
jgi:hypothetical protein